MRKFGAKKTCVVVMCILLLSLLASCGGSGDASPSVADDASAPDRDPAPKIAEIDASGGAKFSGNGATVDYSNASAGYVMVKYTGDNDKVKVLIKFGSEEAYSYDLPNTHEFVAFPLSRGSGTYNIGVYTNVSGKEYATAAQQDITADIGDQLAPYLHANVFANFNASSQCVAEAQRLVTGAKSDNGATEKVFLWLVENVKYDYDKAKTVQPGYIPTPDETLQTKKGICCDYASLMSSMLRSQGIPCQLIVGYAGQAYHAWVAVYSKATGEVANIYQFKNDTWNRMDPTFIAGVGGDASLLGDGETYNPMFYY